MNLKFTAVIPEPAIKLQCAACLGHQVRVRLRGSKTTKTGGRGKIGELNSGKICIKLKKFYCYPLFSVSQKRG